MKAKPVTPKQEVTDVAVRQEASVALDKNEWARSVLGETYDYDKTLMKIKVCGAAATYYAAEAVKQAFEAGKCLCVIQGMEEYGQIVKAIEATGIPNQRAYEWMHLYQELKDAPVLELLFDAGISKLLEITKLSEEKKREVLQTGMLDGDPIKQMRLVDLRERVKGQDVKIQKLEEKAKLAEDKAQKNADKLADVEGQFYRLKHGGRAETDEEVCKLLDEDGQELTTHFSRLFKVDLNACTEDTALRFKAHLELWIAKAHQLLNYHATITPAFDDLQIAVPLSYIQDALRVERANVAIEDPELCGRLEVTCPVEETIQKMEDAARKPRPIEEYVG